MSEAARSRRDDARYEPTVTVPGREPVSRDTSDPLAELARLVGQDDPFRNVFRPAAARPAPGQAVPQGYDDPAGEAAHHDPYAPHDPYAAETYPRPAEGDRHPDDLRPEDHHAYDPAYAHGDGYDEAAAEPYDDDDAYHDAQHYADEAAQAGDHGREGAPAAMLPDEWARSQDHVHGAAPVIDRDEGARDGGGLRSSPRRPVAVLGAVLLLTVGGLAATFLAKGSSSANVAAAGSGRGAPTILAATGPTKVKVDDGSATAPEDQDAALLNKAGNLTSGPVKIVSSQEQPVDLGQLPKSDLADGARPLPQPPASPFPEPKKVKTFLVHPDGTMMSGDAAASGTAPSSPGAGLPAPLPATPATAARGGTTPSAAPTLASIASLSADPAPADSEPTAAVPAPARPARQAASPGVHQASLKPADTAATPAEHGGFGVQLASSPNQADADAAFAKLKRKYPTQLGGYTATVHKAETGARPVYRVRIGGMSQDEAKSLCSKLQTAGGSCFVMRN